MSLAADGVWKGGVWAPTVWADGVWYESVVIQQQSAGAAPGYDWFSKPRRKKKKAVEDEAPAAAPIPAEVFDRDAPLREFIARQELRDRERISAPEPQPFDPRPMLEAIRLEAERIEKVRKRRNTKLFLLLTE